MSKERIVRTVLILPCGFKDGDYLEVFPTLDGFELEINEYETKNKYLRFLRRFWWTVRCEFDTITSFWPWERDVNGKRIWFRDFKSQLTSPRPKGWGGIYLKKASIKKLRDFLVNDRRN